MKIFNLKNIISSLKKIYIILPINKISLVELNYRKGHYSLYYNIIIPIFLFIK